ncbi:MAG: RNA polymerase sigma factor [Ruminococcus sp.]|nr:RNA polymerase sigma factor [Ruminococcus sp.]
MAIEELVREYSNMLFRICMVMLGNEQDAQDVVQETFCRYLERSESFKDSGHEKAWLIKVATNGCRDIHRHRIRHPSANIDDITAYCEMPEQSEIVLSLIGLPDKFKVVIYLHYIEGYKSAEIAGMLGISTEAVKKRLQRGREALRLSIKKQT